MNGFRIANDRVKIFGILPQLLFQGDTLKQPGGQLVGGGPRINGYLTVYIPAYRYLWPPVTEEIEQKGVCFKGLG